MATIRHHARIDRSPDEVWAAVADAGGISTWFPLIETSRVEADVRHCTLQGGGRLEEEIVTPDEVADQLDGALADGLQGLKAHLEP